MIQFYFVVAISLFLGACSSLAPVKFKEGLVVNNQVQYTNIEDLARSSSNAVDFASKVYIGKSDKKDADSYVVDKFWVADKSYVDQKRYNKEDRQVFSTYCKSKNGEIFQWDADSRTSQYGQFRGINKRFVTCEVNSEIESAMIHESYGRDSTVFPFETFTTFANGIYVEKLFREGKVKGYTSSNGIITLPQSKLYDTADKVRFVSDTFTVIFNYQNTSTRPVEINLMNSYATINGSRYDLGFDKGRSGKDVISWKSYSGGAESQGVFVGDNGSQLGKLRFNPGQMLQGEFSFHIPGLTKLSAEDMKTFALQFDGIACDGFQLVSYYDLNKKSDKSLETTRKTLHKATAIQ
jgi:hypothetical protein